MRPQGVLLGAAFALWTGAIEGQDPTARTAGFVVLGSSFVAIQTADVEAAASWYESVLGLAEINRIDAEDGRYSIRLLSWGGLTVELLQVRGAQAPPQGHLGLFKAGFYVSDIVAAHRWLRARGSDTDPDIFVDAALQVRSFVFRDHDGNRLQMFESCAAEC